MALIWLIVIFCHAWDPSTAEYPLEEAFEFDLFQFGALSDTSCSSLMDPDHGNYACHSNAKGQQVCKLTCQKGYLMPFTQYSVGKKLSLKERGTYTCMRKRGMPIAWYPVQMFDCVEIVHPTAIQQYFYLKLPVTPAACNSRQEDALKDRFQTFAQFRSKTAKLCMATNTSCSWEVYVTCVQTVWVVDVILAFPFSKDKLVEWPKLANREMIKDIPYFKVDKQTGGQTKKGRRALVIVCPAGTRISQDFLCHGCSLGYYMDESLMECQPCPKRYYQDKAGKTVCNSCPSGTPGSSSGGKHIASCYTFIELTQRTDLLTATALVTTLVTVVSGLLAYRYRVQHEMRATEEESTFLIPDTDRFQNRRSEVSNRAMVSSMGESQFVAERQENDEPDVDSVRISFKPVHHHKKKTMALGQHTQQVLSMKPEATGTVVTTGERKSHSKTRPNTLPKQQQS